MKFTTVLTHDAEDDGKAKASADAGGLGSEEWVEYARLNALRNSGTIIADFQEHALFRDALGLYTDGAACSLLLDGLTGVADKIHEHLLELPGVAVNEREHGLEINLHSNIVGGGIKALQLQGSGDHLVEGDAATLRTRVPGGKQELAQDSAGSLGLLKDLARLVRITEGIAAQEQALSVAENAGQRVA